MSGRRLLRTAATGLLVLLAATGTAVAAPDQPGGSASAPASEPAGGVTVTLDAVTPAVLEPGGTLGVQVTVRNGSRATVEDPVVSLTVRRQRLASRTDLQSWADGDLRTGPVVATSPSDAQPAGEPAAALAPGASRTVDLTAPEGALELASNPFQWGPRGLEVTVDAGGDTVATTRSFFVWEPADGGYEPSRVSVLVPLTDGPPDVLDGTVPVERIEEQTAPEGRLSTLLAAAEVPGVTWAVDPALLQAAAGGPPATGDGSTDAPDPPTDGPTQAPGGSQAAEWLDGLRAAAPEHEVIALPYGDPDVAALVHARAQRIYRLAEQLGRDAEDLLGVPVRGDVAWPVSGTVDDPTLTALVGSGRNAVVLSGGAQPPLQSLSATPTGRSRVPATPEPVAGLLVDTQLSTTLASTDGRPVNERDRDSLESRTTGATVQRLLAETAAVTMERPFDPRHVLVTAPRGWDPEPDAAVAAVQALTTAPWMQVRPLGELLATPPPNVRRDDLLYPQDDRDDELSADLLAEVADSLDRAATTASLLEDTNAALVAAERSAVAAAAASWRDQRDEWAEQVGALVAREAQRAQAVAVLPGSSLNVVSSDVDLPVTVGNQLEDAVTVQVRLVPRSSRLVVEDAVTVTIPARSQRRVSVPVKAVGNGNTDVAVQLQTPTGASLGEPVTMTVRVRADWETWGTLTIGTVVGLVLLFGLVRGIRRGRRQRALVDPVAAFHPVPSADEALDDRPEQPSEHESASPSEPGAEEPRT